MSKSKPLIHVKNVYKTYKLTETVTIQALKDVSLKIYKGEFISIIGKSGSGKSTLMHILGFLDTPTKGNVYLKGKDISNFTESQLAKIRNKEVGFVFQSFNLLERTTALENVMLPLMYSKVPKKEWRARALEKLKLVGLESRINNKSNELSGGQKQRVAIARALVNNPDIILADEPTGNLDTKTGNQIIELFKDLHKMGKTIVLVTHDEDLAKIAKRKVTILDGKLVNA